MDRATFDEASAAWRENKIARKGGAFSYKCTYVHSNGKLCKKACVNIVQTLCKRHTRFGNTCLNTVSDICNKTNGATATTTTTTTTTTTVALSRDK